MKDLVELLSQDIKKIQISSDERNYPLSVKTTNMGQPKDQTHLDSCQAATEGQMSPMQANVRQSADRDDQGFQTFPIEEHRDTHREKRKMQMSIPFK